MKWTIAVIPSSTWIKIQYEHFLPRNAYWKYRPQNGSHIVQTSTCWIKPVLFYYIPEKYHYSAELSCALRSNGKDVTQIRLWNCWAIVRVLQHIDRAITRPQRTDRRIETVSASWVCVHDPAGFLSGPILFHIRDKWPRIQYQLFTHMSPRNTLIHASRISTEILDDRCAESKEMDRKKSVDTDTEESCLSHGLFSPKLQNSQ